MRDLVSARNTMEEEGCAVLTDKRKTLGVFMNKADLSFQAVVQKITRQCARDMGYDVF